MKVLSAFLMFILLGVAANAQTAPVRVASTISINSESTVKGAPFSAEAISESVQVLADGNRITRSTTSKLYRNSEGRFRREGIGGTGGVLGSVYELQPSISIIDPVVGYRYYLNPDSKTGRSVILRAAPEAVGSGTFHSVTVGKENEQAMNELKAKLAAAGKEHEKAVLEFGAAQAAGGGTNIVIAPQADHAAVERAVAVTRATTAVRAITPLGVEGGFSFSGFSAGAGNSRTEQLGEQNIEGVNAEGTRTITTIEAGKIGNERPIEIVYERWYSKDLQLVVMSKHSDPRSGEQTYRLTNINRSEPDPSLFSPPSEYKITGETDRLIRTTPAKSGGRTVYTTKTPTAVNVKSTKP